MKTIPTETIIPLGDVPTIYSPQRIVIRVDDQAGGPYLCIEGIDDEPDGSEEWRSHSFYLCSEKDIDEFTVICKRILLEADLEKTNDKSKSA